MAETTTKKRKKSTPLNARAMKDLRELGFVCGVVERRLPHCFITSDFLGCMDIIAARDGVGVLGVQVTGGDHHSHRREKSLAEPRLRAWLSGGGRFEIWSYDLRGAKGARKLYRLRREELKLADMPPVPPLPLPPREGKDGR